MPGLLIKKVSILSQTSLGQHCLHMFEPFYILYHFGVFFFVSFCHLVRYIAATVLNIFSLRFGVRIRLPLQRRGFRVAGLAAVPTVEGRPHRLGESGAGDLGGTKQVHHEAQRAVQHHPVVFFEIVYINHIM